MELTKLYDLEKQGQMRVVGLMSGSGTNLVNILKHERMLKEERGKSPYHVAVIFSDNPKSNAVEIGSDFNVPVFVYDMNSFYAGRGKLLNDMPTRQEFEARCLNVFDQFECTVAAYAGYMRKATPVFVNSFLGVNVHPADLSIVGSNGKPKYRGDHAVLDAILAGEKEIRATTHIVTNNVDCGNILMISAPCPVILPAHFNLYDERDTKDKSLTQSIEKENQDKLKQIGDWIIFPRTIEHIAEGDFAKDENNDLYFQGEKIPQGLRLG